VIVDEAIQFIRTRKQPSSPFLAVIWYGSPHSPWRATDADRVPFASLSKQEQHHYGELVAMDRSIGTLRHALREMSIEKNTLVWFCSDNGGLQPFGPETVGGLRGWKNTLYEGGLRVPAIIEWPERIPAARITSFPASTLDIFPTLAEIAGLPNSVLLEPQDGMSLVGLFAGNLTRRGKPIPFRHQGRAALVDNDFKLFCPDLKKQEYQLYNLAEDPTESVDVADRHPETLQRLRALLEDWTRSVDASVRGEDYPGGHLAAPDPQSRFWMTAPEYEPYLDDLRKRPEYSERISKTKSQK